MKHTTAIGELILIAIPCSLLCIREAASVSSSPCRSRNRLKIQENQLHFGLLLRYYQTFPQTYLCSVYGLQVTIHTGKQSFGALSPCEKA